MTPGRGPGDPGLLPQASAAEGAAPGAAPVAAAPAPGAGGPYGPFPATHHGPAGTGPLEVPRGAYGSARDGVAGRLTDLWRQVPLQARLVGLVAALLVAGLSLAGSASSVFLHRSLVTQLDEKLEVQAKALLSTGALQQWLARPDQDLYPVYPVDYCAWLESGGLTSNAIASRTTLDQYGTPRLPAAVPATAEVDGRVAAYTVTSDSGQRWRAVTYDVPTDGPAASITVALPLAQVQGTEKDLLGIVLLSGLGIVLLGVVCGGWAVHRSLRPLREVERTAGAIAAGDLSRRVPAAHPGTEMGRLSGALNTMLTQIESSFRAREASEGRMRRFVADASHELRTPLAAIRGYGELYRMGAIREPEQLEDTMRRIEGSATRMGVLVEDLLALARLDERRPLRTTDVDLTVLAADAVSDLHAIDPARPARIVPLPEGAPAAAAHVVADEGALRQVLANLVGNVVAHTPAGTPVEVAVGTLPAAPGEVVLEVRDHGPGIPPEHAERVFERFYRVDASRGRGGGGGAGLGMAIVAAVVDAHAGHVGILPTPGGGATVRVRLPVAGPAPAPVPRQAPEPAPPGAPPPAGTPTGPPPGTTQDPAVAPGTVATVPAPPPAAGAAPTG
ncbi:sensor histidine kinase [Cellulomonas endophytica]|uniref:sensor histidine kinase n=1 Tax=Cellulomonas endophytica TaxID=2494735 RepID=UPI001F0B728C|nr:HAMP domain-containing sensor histidine kinase [Cellulomonas endophytica]